MTKLIPPKLDHVSIRVKRFEHAIVLLEQLGWKLEEGRKAEWETGYSYFMRHPLGGPFIQLTFEKLGEPGDPGDSDHLAFAFESIEQLTNGLGALSTFCQTQKLQMDIETVGKNKYMVLVPEVFYGAIELVLEEGATSDEVVIVSDRYVDGIKNAGDAQ